MKLYNTLTGNREDFSTPDGKVRMYVCGITPYSASHIGHAMSSVAFDIVRRYLEFKGYEVIHIQNFTDIDDKMIKTAADQGISIGELAESNIQAYLDEMDTLNVLRASNYPRATQEIPKILEIIESLVEKGYAYPMDGDVYFRVQADEDYGKLSHRSLDSLMAGARVEIDENKEDAMDFVLWKGQKPGEPAWDSPWGPGRPGWHIECSAMSLVYLGETIDIHGGGQDLIFPHHENEIAQSESYTDKDPFTRFWMHNGLLRLGEDKMSKSLGNIISVHEVLQKYSPDAVRLFILSSHYRSPLVYNDQSIESQERALERLRNSANVSNETENGRPSMEELNPLPYRERFIEAMDDDLNTPRALATLFDLSRDINRGHEEKHSVSDAQATLKELSGLLGLTLKESQSAAGDDIGPLVELLIEIRSDLRGVKQYELADKIRNRLTELEITLEDKSQGTEWKSRRH